MIGRVSKGGLTHLLFFLSSNIRLEFFYANLGVNVFSKLAMSHVIRRVSKGGVTHLLFYISSNIGLEFYAKFEGQRFVETGDVSRPGTNSMSLGWSPRVV